MLKQKLMGLALIILGAISAAITGDSTAAVLLYIIGLAAIFTKDYILTLDETKKSARNGCSRNGRRGCR